MTHEEYLRILELLNDERCQVSIRKDEGLLPGNIYTLTFLVHYPKGSTRYQIITLKEETKK